MNDATRTFEITLNERYSISTWWNKKYPQEPYWKVMLDGHADKVMRKYQKGVFKDIRQMLQKHVGKAIITELRLIANLTFSVTVMGEQDEINMIDPSNIR